MFDFTTDCWAAMPPADVPTATDWFFVASRSGSGQLTAQAAFNSHPSIHCRIGWNLPGSLATILRSTLVDMGANLWIENLSPTARHLRFMLEGWRKAFGTTDWYGDVSCMYYGNGPILAGAFPGAVRFVTVRHHLDRVRTFFKLYGLLDGLTPDEVFALFHHYAVVYGLVGDTRLFKEDPQVVPIIWESNKTAEGFVGSWTEVFARIGAEVTPDVTAGLVRLAAQTVPSAAIGDWQTDTVILDCLDRMEDKEVADLLRSGAWTMSDEQFARYQNTAKPKVVADLLAARGMWGRGTGD